MAVAENDLAGAIRTSVPKRLELLPGLILGIGGDPGGIDNGSRGMRCRGDGVGVSRFALEENCPKTQRDECFSHPEWLLEVLEIQKRTADCNGDLCFWALLPFLEIALAPESNVWVVWIYMNGCGEVIESMPKDCDRAVEGLESLEEDLEGLARYQGAAARLQGALVRSVARVGDWAPASTGDEGRRQKSKLFNYYNAWYDYYAWVEMAMSVSHWGSGSTCSHNDNNNDNFSYWQLRQSRIHTYHSTSHDSSTPISRIHQMTHTISGSSPAESGYNSGRGSVEQRGRLIGFNYSGGELIPCNIYRLSTKQEHRNTQSGNPETGRLVSISKTERKRSNLTKIKPGQEYIQDAGYEIESGTEWSDVADTAMLTKQDYTETGLRLSPGPGMRGCARRWVGVAGLGNRGPDMDMTIMMKQQWPKPRNVAGAKLRRNVVKEERRLREEAEKRRREEEEKRLREEQEAETERKRREEEQRQREEAQRKDAEANKKRQREEVEAGSSVARGSGMCCVRCARAGVPCEFTNDGNKRRTACDRCAAQREKCEWPEMYAPGAAKGKGKAKEVPTSPRQGERKKRVCKTKVQDDDEVEIVGERMAGAGPSRISLDRLVEAIEEMSNRMSELAQAHRESTQAFRESTQVSRKARKALERFVDEAALCGALEESEEESSDEEEVDEGELAEEMAGLEEDKVENPMSPPKRVGDTEVRS
ncbi:hypothetical protein BU15DRAFT_60656 [Melanogaster broomeanus]|nr:hypothetical protein BU15DRAFT_60656 [Melanogaster broomeanus]